MHGHARELVIHLLESFSAYPHDLTIVQLVRMLGMSMSAVCGQVVRGGTSVVISCVRTHR